MRLAIAGVAAGAAALWATAAGAVDISPGQTVSRTVDGTDAIYQIFGHAGNPGSDYGPATDAVLLSFLSGAGRVFDFSATGVIGCCNYATNSAFTPDGAPGGMNITGANGLSSLSGNGQIPLVGVFTTDVDPSGGIAPAALTFDRNTPLSLSPLLNQVFYIGDGRAGADNASGALLTFAAPTTATRLYIGAIDAFSFGGTTGFYNDNAGSFSVDVHMARIPETNPQLPGVPEPATWALMIGGFGLAGGALRRRRSALA